MLAQLVGHKEDSWCLALKTYCWIIFLEVLRVLSLCVSMWCVWCVQTCMWACVCVCVCVCVFLHVCVCKYNLCVCLCVCVCGLIRSMAIIETNRQCFSEVHISGVGRWKMLGGAKPGKHEDDLEIISVQCNSLQPMPLCLLSNCLQDCICLTLK